MFAAFTRSRIIGIVVLGISAEVVYDVELTSTVLVYILLLVPNVAGIATLSLFVVDVMKRMASVMVLAKYSPSGGKQHCFSARGRILDFCGLLYGFTGQNHCSCAVHVVFGEGGEYGRRRNVYVIISNYC